MAIQGESNRADGAEDSAGFRFHLVTGDGAVVGVHERATPLRAGDVVALDAAGEGWRVVATLGHVARVERVGDTGDGARAIRVSASSEGAARLLAETLGGGATAARTPHGWVVSLPLADQPRVTALTRLAAASRSVVSAYPDAELFVLDGERPVRLPPPV